MSKDSYRDDYDERLKNLQEKFNIVDIDDNIINYILKLEYENEVYDNKLIIISGFLEDLNDIDSKLYDTKYKLQEVLK